jgi:cyclin-dependent kinase 12/13
VPPTPLSKRPADSVDAPIAKRARAGSVGQLSIRAPVVLRDVNVFTKKHQVGQGTYGSVFVGQDKVTNEIVALKRINTKQEENGFPITALREVKILKVLTHPNIVTLKEIVTSKEQGEIPKNVFMVFEYLEYDLTGVLETSEIRLTQDHVKSWSQQLLGGVHYMHTNKVIHRDLKASNLLINRQGELKIADWGLARSWNSEMKRLTNKVITLWYRPPELLLGCLEYTDKIDMWSVGCIIAEMFRRSGFLKGSNEATQLDLIFRTCGHPTKEEWPSLGDKCRLWKKLGPNAGQPRFPNRLAEALRAKLPNPKWMTDNAIELIAKLMALNPDHRWSAEQALDAEYFFENPIVKPANKLVMNFAVHSVHEWDCRRKFEQKMAQQRQAQQQTNGVHK